jgi:hypothetical protein
LRLVIFEVLLLAAFRMFCVLWFLPLFLLPTAHVEPYLMFILLVIAFLRFRPCLYCTLVVLGLMYSSCSISQFYSSFSILKYDERWSMLWINSSSVQSFVQHAMENHYNCSIENEGINTSETLPLCSSVIPPPAVGGYCWFDVTAFVKWAAKAAFG